MPSLQEDSNKYDKLGCQPTIFNDLPIKAPDIKVVLYYNSMPYGERPGEVQRCLMTRFLAKELKKVPGIIVPRKIFDFREWQNRGILHLTEQEYSKRDIYFMIRWLSLHKKGLIFVLVNKDAHLMAKFFMDNSDESNIFITCPDMKDSDVFKIIHDGLKDRKLPTINWSCV